jgi:hypothetical protein
MYNSKCLGYNRRKISKPKSIHICLLGLHNKMPRSRQETIEMCLFFFPSQFWSLEVQNEVPSGLGAGEACFLGLLTAVFSLSSHGYVHAYTKQKHSLISPSNKDTNSTVLVPNLHDLINP